MQGHLELLEGALLVNNSAYAAGGAVFVADMGSKGMLNVSSAFFIGNTGRSGGAISVQRIAGPAADASQAGLSPAGGRRLRVEHASAQAGVVIDGCLLVGNSAHDGPGGAIEIGMRDPAEQPKAPSAPRSSRLLEVSVCCGPISYGIAMWRIHQL